ncbi:MAG: acetyl-CoA carboxylase carboxyltransferase subunit alpha [Pseudomonadota bacterium]
MMPLDFEKNVYQLEGKLKELRSLSDTGDINIADEVKRLDHKIKKLLRSTYGKLTPWQKVQVARHPERPNFKEYVAMLLEDFVELSGDRAFADDQAILGGLGRFRGTSVVIMGHQKGRNTEDRVKHNFGMALPEGYRKARRLMELADRFQLPVITLVDTAGAYPGLEAEERGQSEAIARSIETMGALKVPVVSTITGEGGSGGAIAIAVGNRVHMLEHAVYSVISPEGCAAILWRTRDKKDVAAAALKLTAKDLLKLGIIDTIITEPLGGAHRNAERTIKRVGQATENALSELIPMSAVELQQHRREKFLAMGRVA